MLSRALLVGLVAIASIGLASAQSEEQEYRGPRINYQIDGASQLDEDTVAKLDAMANKYMLVAAANYDLIVKTLEVQDKPLPTKFVVILMSPDYEGSAVTYGYQGGMVIKIGDKYALRSPNDLGVIVHEMTHVVQQYHKGEHPTWLGEGIADYVRWFFYEPNKKRPHPKSADADARKSYRVTASFLYWTAVKYDNELVPKLNMVLQAGRYNEDVWRQITGLTLDQLNAEWKSEIAGEEAKKDQKKAGGGR